MTTLRRFLEKAQGAVVADLPSLTVEVLEIREGSGSEAVYRYGFIFGSELVLNALTMYERFGRGYRGLARFERLAARSSSISFISSDLNLSRRRPLIILRRFWSVHFVAPFTTSISVVSSAAM